jgi:hypothetical protein
MPRTYNTKLGARRYADYSEDTLKECLDCIRNGELSWKKTSAKYNIPFRIIANKIKKYHQQCPGRPPVFSAEEEQAFASYIETLSDFGFPLTCDDFRHVVKSYMDRAGRKENQFCNNLPGKDWVKSLQRT